MDARQAGAASAWRARTRWELCLSRRAAGGTTRVRCGGRAASGGRRRVGGPAPRPCGSHRPTQHHCPWAVEPGRGGHTGRGVDGSALCPGLVRVFTSGRSHQGQEGRGGVLGGSAAPSLPRRLGSGGALRSLVPPGALPPGGIRTVARSEVVPPPLAVACRLVMGVGVVGESSLPAGNSRAGATAMAVAKQGMPSGGRPLLACVSA